VRNGTWVTPTLVVFVTAAIGERELTTDERLKYIPATTRERWRNQWRERPAGSAERQETLNKSRVQIVKLMHRTRVGLLAGTDILNPFLFPGFSLHHELVLLVQAGLSPLEALRTATLNPARFLGREKELGTVERGKLADLVLLDADPLQDIHHTQRIAAVIIGGRLYDRASLDAMLGSAASDANR
jgi:imidazolonepropionase-like amidohydrolase